MSKSTQRASGDRAKCDGPIEGFVAFAKGLTAKSAAKRLQKLSAGPDGSRFAERLVQEAFGGSAHAATCMSLVGRFGGDPDWADRLQAVEATGNPPSPAQLQAKELAPVGQGLLVVAREKALPWIAQALLRLNRASASRTALQTLLLEAASTTHELAGALSDALGALEAGGLQFTKGMAKLCADTLEQHGHRHAVAGPEATQSPLGRLATVANRADAARLVSALTLAQAGKVAGEGDDSATTSARRRAATEVDAPPAGPSEVTDRIGPPAGSSVTTNAIAQAAWSEADEALGRALQDMDFLDRSFEKLESAAQGELAERTRKAKDASELVLQWVRQAARHRSVAALSKVGDRVPFDPSKLKVDGDAQIGELVRVVKPPVVRGSEPRQVVLLQGEAEVE